MSKEELSHLEKRLDYDAQLEMPEPTKETYDYEYEVFADLDPNKIETSTTALDAAVKKIVRCILNAKQKAISGEKPSLKFLITGLNCGNAVIDSPKIKKLIYTLVSRIEFTVGCVVEDDYPTMDSLRLDCGGNILKIKVDSDGRLEGKNEDAQDVTNKFIFNWSIKIVGKWSKPVPLDDTAEFPIEEVLALRARANSVF